MKRRTAIALTTVGCVTVAGTTPALIYGFSGGKFTGNLRANYVDGLALMADWSDNHDAKKRFENQAYLIRAGVNSISFDCENEAEQAMVWNKIWATATEVTRTGHDVAGDHPGRLTFYVPNNEATTLKDAGDQALAEARAKRDAQTK